MVALARKAKASLTTPTGVLFLSFLSLPQSWQTAYVPPRQVLGIRADQSLTPERLKQIYHNVLRNGAWSALQRQNLLSACLLLLLEFKLSALQMMCAQTTLQMEEHLSARVAM